MTQSSPLCLSPTGLASCWRTRPASLASLLPGHPQPTSQNTSTHWLYQTAYSFFPMPMLLRVLCGGTGQANYSLPGVPFFALGLPEVQHWTWASPPLYCVPECQTSSSGCPLHSGEVSLQESSLVWGLHCHHYHFFGAWVLESRDRVPLLPNPGCQGSAHKMCPMIVWRMNQWTNKS